MASITKIKKQNGSISYRVVWRVGHGNERRQEYKSFDNAEDARRHRRQMEEEVESRRVGTVKGMSVRTYLDTWIEDVKRRAHRGDLSPSGARTTAARPCTCSRPPEGWP